MKRFLNSWGIELTPKIRIIPYEQIRALKGICRGTYIFSDIERLTEEQSKLATEVWEELSSGQKGVRLLNHPMLSMRRYQLLRTLKESGLNSFNLYRLAEELMPKQFPVFIRVENDHRGSLTPLIRTPEELQAVISKFSQQGDALEDKVAIEFCDTSDEKGIFRKYSAFIVGNRIVPRHVLFSRNWVVKHPELTDISMIREENHYIESNPHERQLRKLFQMARISYGRIDYGILNGRLQVWEINTNPNIMGSISSSIPERLGIHQFFLKHITSAFECIDCGTNLKTLIRISARTRFSKTGRRTCIKWFIRDIFGFILNKIHVSNVTILSVLRQLHIFKC
ncbi:MAG: hypothetical protein NUV86_03185 [Candidatus Scalindua sp.]|nr:hypothetical protein [Candidatus Scalindua sp.]